MPTTVITGRDVTFTLDSAAYDAQTTEAMWTDAESAANTTLAVSFTAVTGAVFAFNVLPIFPAAGGAAPSALTDTWTMTVVGTPTETFS